MSVSDKIVTRELNDLINIYRIIMEYLEEYESGQTKYRDKIFTLSHLLRETINCLQATIENYSIQFGEASIESDAIEVVSLQLNQLGQDVDAFNANQSSLDFVLSSQSLIQRIENFIEVTSCSLTSINYFDILAMKYHSIVLGNRIFLLYAEQNNTSTNSDEIRDLVGFIRQFLMMIALNEDELQERYNEFVLKAAEMNLELLGIETIHDFRRLYNVNTKQLFSTEEILKILTRLIELKVSNPDITMTEQIKFFEVFQDCKDRVTRKKETLEEILQLQREGLNAYINYRKQKEKRAEVKSLLKEIQNEFERNKMVELVEEECLSDEVKNELESNRLGQREQYIARLVYFQEWLLRLKSANNDDVIKDIMASLDFNATEYENFLVSNVENIVNSSKKMFNFLSQLTVERQARYLENETFLQEHFSNNDSVVEDFVSFLNRLGQNEVAQQIVPSITGLHHVTVKGDGNCFYTAVAYYLGEDQASLRRIVAENLAEDPERYRGFIPLSEGQILEDYISNVSNTNAWAGDVEITVLSEVLRRPIVVIGPDGRVMNVERAMSHQGDPIFVTYNGVNHYDSLILDGSRADREIFNSLIESQRDNIEVARGEEVLREKDLIEQASSMKNTHRSNKLKMLMKLLGQAFVLKYSKEFARYDFLRFIKELSSEVFKIFFDVLDQESFQSLFEEYFSPSDPYDMPYPALGKSLTELGRRESWVKELYLLNKLGAEALKKYIARYEKRQFEYFLSALHRYNRMRILQMLGRSFLDTQFNEPFNWVEFLIEAPSSQHLVYIDLFLGRLSVENNNEEGWRRLLATFIRRISEDWLLIFLKNIGLVALRKLNDSVEDLINVVSEITPDKIEIFINFIGVEFFSNKVKTLEDFCALFKSCSNDCYKVLIKILGIEFIRSQIKNSSSLLSFITFLDDHQKKTFIKNIGFEFLQRLNFNVHDLDALISDIDPESSHVIMIGIFGLEFVMNIIHEVSDLQTVMKWIQPSRQLWFLNKLSGEKLRGMIHSFKDLCHVIFCFLPELWGNVTARIGADLIGEINIDFLLLRNILLRLSGGYLRTHLVETLPRDLLLNEIREGSNLVALLNCFGIKSREEMFEEVVGYDFIREIRFSPAQLGIILNVLSDQAWGSQLDADFLKNNIRSGRQLLDTLAAIPTARRFKLLSLLGTDYVKEIITDGKFFIELLSFIIRANWWRLFEFLGDDFLNGLNVPGNTVEQAYQRLSRSYQTVLQREVGDENSLNQLFARGMSVRALLNFSASREARNAFFDAVGLSFVEEHEIDMPGENRESIFGGSRRRRNLSDFDGDVQSLYDWYQGDRWVETAEPGPDASSNVDSDSDSDSDNDGSHLEPFPTYTYRGSYRHEDQKRDEEEICMVSDSDDDSKDSDSENINTLDDLRRVEAIWQRRREERENFYALMRCQSSDSSSDDDSYDDDDSSDEKSDSSDDDSSDNQSDSSNDDCLFDETSPSGNEDVSSDEESDRRNDNLLEGGQVFGNTLNKVASDDEEEDVDHTVDVSQRENNLADANADENSLGSSSDESESDAEGDIWSQVGRNHSTLFHYASDHESEESEGDANSDDQYGANNPLYEGLHETRRNPLFDGAEDSSNDSSDEEEMEDQEPADVEIIPYEEVGEDGEVEERVRVVITRRR